MIMENMDDMTVQPEVILGLGSNMGDRLTYLEYSIGQLEKNAGKIVARSSVWETEPWGFEAEDMFLNMAVILETTLEPKELLSVISSLEKSMGRKRRKSPEYQSRVIDIDILLWGERIITLPGLLVPHPRIAQRRFVLEPLFEIAPEALHPVSRKTVKEMLALCADQSSVSVYRRLTK